MLASRSSSLLTPKQIFDLKIEKAELSLRSRRQHRSSNIYRSRSLPDMRMSNVHSPSSNEKKEKQRIRALQKTSWRIAYEVSKMRKAEHAQNHSHQNDTLSDSRDRSSASPMDDIQIDDRTIKKIAIALLHLSPTLPTPAIDALSPQSIDLSEFPARPDEEPLRIATDFKFTSIDNEQDLLTPQVFDDGISAERFQRDSTTTSPRRDAGTQQRLLNLRQSPGKSDHHQSQSTYTLNHHEYQKLYALHSPEPPQESDAPIRRRKERKLRNTGMSTSASAFISPQRDYKYDDRTLFDKYWWVIVIIGSVIMILITISCTLLVKQYRFDIKHKQKEIMMEQHQNINLRLKNKKKREYKQCDRNGLNYNLNLLTVEIERTLSDQAPCKMWMICDKIGSGTFGDVRLAIDPQIQPRSNYNSPTSDSYGDPFQSITKRQVLYIYIIRKKRFFCF